MEKDNNKPFEFPQECPEKDRKLDKGVIVDVVENEIKVKNGEIADSQYSMWEYKGKKLP